MNEQLIPLKNCDTCIHECVCSNKEAYKAAQDAVNHVSVPLKDNGLKRLADIDWIIPVKIVCKHYITGSAPFQR